MDEEQVEIKVGYQPGFVSVSISESTAALSPMQAIDFAMSILEATKLSVAAIIDTTPEKEK